MKLISLNVWGGRVFDPLVAFLKEQEPSTDVFCFQEVYTHERSTDNIFGQFTAVLPDFNGFFFPIQDHFYRDDRSEFEATYGQAIFVRSTYKCVREGSMFVYRDRNMLEGEDLTTLPAGFQYITIAKHGTPSDSPDTNAFTIVSMNGITMPGDKLDTSARLAQSEKVREFLRAVDGAKILCGDFNLAPETQSISIFEKDMTNLIKEFHITDTRGRLNAQRYPVKDIQNFADYTFVSPNISVGSFVVPNVEISDHLPMILECSF